MKDNAIKYCCVFHQRRCLCVYLSISYLGLIPIPTHLFSSDQYRESCAIFRAFHAPLGPDVFFLNPSFVHLQIGLCYDNLAVNLGHILVVESLSLNALNAV